jgi:cytochrome P450
VLLMLLFPEAQQAAQEELDAVVGHGRLPEMGDKESLPYITALKMEALRYDTPISEVHTSIN